MYGRHKAIYRLSDNMQKLNSRGFHFLENLSIEMFHKTC